MALVLTLVLVLVLDILTYNNRYRCYMINVHTHISLFDLFSSFAIIPAYFLVLMVRCIAMGSPGHRAHFVGYNFFGFIYYGQFIMDIIPVWLFFGSIINWCRLDVALRGVELDCCCCGCCFFFAA